MLKFCVKHLVSILEVKDWLYGSPIFQVPIVGLLCKVKTRIFYASPNKDVWG